MPQLPTTLSRVSRGNFLHRRLLPDDGMLDHYLLTFAKIVVRPDCGPSWAAYAQVLFVLAANAEIARTGRAGGTTSPGQVASFLARAADTREDFAALLVYLDTELREPAMRARYLPDLHEIAALSWETACVVIHIVVACCAGDCRSPATSRALRAGL